ncbi:DUF3558 family protein [Williamsia sp.]|uniref:DUF3558 family protein n=1 Tax=Williamsia sp. TaxID=1872085 RepID=UPI002F94540D
MTIRNIIVLVLILVAVSGCQNGDTTTKAVPITANPPGESSIVSGTPVPLPFDNRFPNRWNPANDGTSFEPCVAYSDEELTAFGIDPAQIEDVAQVDGQGTRGCSWKMPDGFSLSQVVTNSESLDVYRQGVSEVDWRSDLLVGDRRVGSFGIQYESSELCSTYVQSFKAGVVTNVMVFDSAEGKAAEPCEFVDSFTRAYIDKIPE